MTAVSELASGKPVKQSTTYYSYSANLAVDGNKGTDFSVDKCACTNVGDLYPWWSVDLQVVTNNGHLSEVTYTIQVCSVSLLIPHNVLLFTSIIVFSFHLESNEWI